MFDLGATLNGSTEGQITRFLLARRFGSVDGPHRLRLGARFHWMSLRAEVSGEAHGFRRAVASTEFPFPNVGAWYRYSPNRHWMFTARVDWRGANIDRYSGEIRNASVGANFRAFKQVGLGLTYQYFEGSKMRTGAVTLKPHTPAPIFISALSGSHSPLETAPHGRPCGLPGSVTLESPWRFSTPKPSRTHCPTIA